MQTLKYLSALLLFVSWSMAAQVSSAENRTSPLFTQENDTKQSDSPNFAPDFVISSRLADGQVKVKGLASTWENIILRSLDGATYIVIPNDTPKAVSEVSVDFSNAKSGMYFCEIEYRDRKKSVKSFRLP